MQAAIAEEVFPRGSRLPPTRDLARELGVSRNTVMHVYESLMAQGYVTARTGSGTWIAETLPEKSLQSDAIADLQAVKAQRPATLSKRAPVCWVTRQHRLTSGARLSPARPM